MALGHCMYMTCDSMLGSSFRASFMRANDRGFDQRVDREVLLCSTHEHECRPIRDSMPGKLRLTPDGYVYTWFLMEAMSREVR